jgi:hypothetical protein
VRKLDVRLLVFGFAVGLFLSAALWGMETFILGFRVHHGIVGLFLCLFAWISPSKLSSFLFGFGGALALTDLADYPWR